MEARIYKTVCSVYSINKSFKWSQHFQKKVWESADNLKQALQFYVIYNFKIVCNDNNGFAMDYLKFKYPNRSFGQTLTFSFKEDEAITYLIAVGQNAQH